MASLPTASVMRLATNIDPAESVCGNTRQNSSPPRRVTKSVEREMEALQAAGSI